MTAVMGTDAGPTFVVTEPGVYDIPEDAYHRDPVPGGSLSSTGARRLLPPSCPALFRYEQLHGRPDKRTFDFGHAAHAKVLGVGAPVVIVQATAKDGTKSDAANYNTKSAQEHRDEIRAEGSTPLLASEVEQVDGMAAALLAHRDASDLFDPAGGKPEQSLFCRDETSGVMLRARLDWLPEPKGGRVLIGDYKTTVSADPRSIAKSVATYGYHQQHAFYVDIVRALGIAEDVAFAFAFQMKTAPYLVTVVEIDADAVEAGRRRNQRAIEVYAECVATDMWPSFTDEIPIISLPPWALNEETS